MYIIRVNGQTIHNPELNSEKHVVVDVKLTREVNCADALTFTVYDSNALYDDIEQMQSRVEVRRDNEVIFSGRVLSISRDYDNAKKVTCEGDFGLFNDTVCRPYTYSGYVRGYIELLLNGHNEQVAASHRFNVGNVTVAGSISRASSEYPTTMSELQDKLVGELGGYLVVSERNGVRYLDYLEDSTTASSQEVTIDTNIIDITQEEDGADIITALIPLGAKNDNDERLTIESVNGGKDYIEDAASVQRYGRIVGTHVWDDVTTAAALKQKGIALLSELTKPIKHITLKAEDLNALGTGTEPFEFFSYVYVRDGIHSFTGQYLVTRMEIGIDDPSGDVIELGADSKAISKGTARNSEMTTKIRYNSVTSGQLQQAVNNATDRISGVNGGNVIIHYDQNNHPYEVIYMDTDSELTAVNCVRMNHQGIGMSTTGVNGPYTQALVNGVGLNASAVVTGTLSADRIAADSINATKIAIGNFENLFDVNPDDPSSWPATIVSGGTDGSGNAAVKKTDPTDIYLRLNNGQKRWNLAAWQTIVYEMNVYAPAAKSYRVYLYAFNDNSQIAIGSVFNTHALAAGWNAISGSIEVTDALIDGATRYDMRVNDIGSAESGTDIKVSAPYAQIARSGELIVDGTITAEKIKADEVLTQHLTAQNLDIQGGSVDIETASTSDSRIKLKSGSYETGMTATGVSAKQISGSTVTSEADVDANTGIRLSRSNGFEAGVNPVATGGSSQIGGTASLSIPPSLYAKDGSGHTSYISPTEGTIDGANILTDRNGLTEDGKLSGHNLLTDSGGLKSDGTLNGAALLAHGKLTKNKYIANGGTIKITAAGAYRAIIYVIGGTNAAPKDAIYTMWVTTSPVVYVRELCHASSASVGQILNISVDSASRTATLTNASGTAIWVEVLTLAGDETVE